MVTAINPITFTRDVFSSYTEFLTDFISFKDKSLMDQFKREIEFDLVSGSKIIKGPYVKLNRPFLSGKSLSELSSDYSIPKIIYDKFPFPLYKHQQDAFEILTEGHHLVVSTGTGSGKSESFFIPIINRLMNRKNEGSLNGLHAVLIYPMNALVNDQLSRLRKILAGTGITFGRFTGETVSGRMPDAIRVLDAGTQSLSEEDKRGMEEGTVIPSEELYTRDQMRKSAPNILITNYSQLEYMLLRSEDIAMFDGCPLEFVVMDEMHTYAGEQGSEVAALLRRLRCLCANPDAVQFVGTSATVASGTDEEKREAVSRFAARLFGVAADSVKCVFEQYKDVIETNSGGHVPLNPLPGCDVLELLERLVQISSADVAVINRTELYEIYRSLSGIDCPDSECLSSFRQNPIILDMMLRYSQPGLVSDSIQMIRSVRGSEVSEENALAEIYCYLILGLLFVDEEGEPILRPKLHFFFKGVHDLRLSFDEGERVLSLNDSTRKVSFDLYSCRICGMHYLKGNYSAALQDGDRLFYQLSNDPEDMQTIYFTDNSDFLSDENKMPYMLCEDCGTLHVGSNVTACSMCSSRSLKKVYKMVESHKNLKCCACGTNLADALDGERNRKLIRATSSEPVDLTIVLENMLSSAVNPKAIVFVDNRQEASFLSGYLKIASRRFVWRDRLYAFFKENGDYYAFSELSEAFFDYMCSIGEITPVKAKGAAKKKNSEAYLQVEWFLQEEFCSDLRAIKRGSLEKLELLNVLYEGINLDKPEKVFEEFCSKWAEELQVPESFVVSYCVLLLNYFRSHSVLTAIAQKLFFGSQRQKVRSVLNIPRYFGLYAVGLNPTGDASSKDLLSSNGRSYAQVLAKKMLHQGHLVQNISDPFFEELFSLFVKMEILIGKDQRFYLNPEKIYVDFVSESRDSRYVCSKCAESFSTAVFSDMDDQGISCPVYNCKGELELQKLSGTGYDKRRYLSNRGRFELKPAEHTGQIGNEARKVVENQFKNGQLNVLIATSTLELGIDIGDLEIALMRNVPPTSANYDQRSGRAGRRHRIAVNATYCGSSTHDTLFFERPEDMINGDVKTPVFSMRNYPLIQRHIHSLVFTTLMRQSSDDCIAESEREKICLAFPRYMNGYFPELKENDRYSAMKSKIDFVVSFKVVLKQYSATLKTEILKFFDLWDTDDLNALCQSVKCSDYAELAAHFLSEISESLEVVLRHLRDKYLFWCEKSDELNKKRIAFNPYNKILGDFEGAAERHSMRFHTIGYLRENGFLPGYNLVQPGIAASREDGIDIQRPVQIALREYAPFSLIYADSKVYDVNQYYIESSEHQEVLKEVSLDSEEGKRNFKAIQITNLELGDERRISRDDTGRMVRSYDIQGAFFENASHLGGKTCSKGKYRIDFYRSGTLELYNTHLRYKGNELHFYICPVCGWVFNHMSDEQNLLALKKHMKKVHGNDKAATSSILYTPFVSDVLRIRSFVNVEEAVNVAEAIRRGAMQAADMDETDIDYFTGYDEAGYYALIYENVPGGSGFVEHIFTHFNRIREVALDHLNSCDCGSESGNTRKACYRCLLSFWNQYHHGILDREMAAELLSEFNQNTDFLEIPQNVSAEERDKETDSTFEDTFYKVLRKMNVPLPVKQYKMNSPNTIVDFAWSDKKVAVYIDGQFYHSGDRKKTDKRIRMALKSYGWKVVVVKDEDWNDPGLRELKFKELFELLI
ncbi:MAG TPA: DEAD/DEAH box helicase [Thermotogota bacterium]|nr:DEAD/DEAH box helicase [Thermotogota bacterium]